MMLMSLTVITLSVHRRIYKWRTRPSRSLPPMNRCLLRTEYHQPAHNPPHPSSALPSRHPNLPLLLPLNPRYPQNSTLLLHHVSHRHNTAHNRNEAVTGTGIAAIYRGMCLLSRLPTGHAVMTIDSQHNNHSVPNLRHRECRWSRRS